MRTGDVLWLPRHGGGFPLVVVLVRPRKRVFIARAFSWARSPELSPDDLQEELWVGLTHDGAVKDGTWTSLRVNAAEHALEVPTSRTPASGGRWVLMTVSSDDPNTLTASGKPQDFADVAHLPTDDLFDPWLLTSSSTRLLRLRALTPSAMA